MERKDRKIELRSPRMQSIIGSRVHWMMRYGIVLICVLLLLLFSAAWLCPIRTPDGRTATFIERVRGK